MLELGRVGVVVERARYQYVELRLGRLARGLRKVGTGDRAELRPDKDASADLTSGQ